MIQFLSEYSDNIISPDKTNHDDYMKDFHAYYTSLDDPNENDVYFNQCPSPFGYYFIFRNLSLQFDRPYVYDFFKRKMSNDLVFLDFGCGTASISLTFSHLFKKMYFMESQPNFRDFISHYVTSKQLRVDYEILDYQQLDVIPSNSLDFIFIYDVLEHIPDPSPILIALDKKLKIGGLILWRAPWGDTFFGKHPGHRLDSRMNFKNNGGRFVISNNYKKVCSVSILDYYYNQGLFRKTK